MSNTKKKKIYNYCFTEKRKDKELTVEVCVQRRVVSADGRDFYCILCFYPTGESVNACPKFEFKTCEKAQQYLDKLAEKNGWKPFLN